MLIDGEISEDMKRHLAEREAEVSIFGPDAVRYAAALRAIIERADNGALGSSKVQDMRKLAQEALGE